MIPIDNSVAGRVADIHHLMPRSGLHIVAEWFLPVQHQLMAPRGATLKTIKTVESHGRSYRTGDGHGPCPREERQAPKSFGLPPLDRFVSRAMRRGLPRSQLPE